MNTMIGLRSASQETENYLLREATDTVVIVENDCDLEGLFVTTVTKIGMRAQVIRSGDTALTYLYAVIPRALIVDLNLPRVNGETIVRYVRSAEDKRMRQLPVIVTTAFVEEAGKRGVDALANVLLPKPVDIDLLEVSLRWLVGKASVLETARP